MARIEAKGTRSYRVRALPPSDSTVAARRRFPAALAGLALLLAFGLPACGPESPREIPLSRASPLAPPDGHDSARSAPGLERPSAPPARGLWILAEGAVRVLDDPARIPAVLDRAEALGATDLFVQVYRGGRAFYPAAPGIERAPATVALADRGVDALARLLDDATARGLRVHAWVNVLSLSTRPDAALLEALGPGAVLVDRAGRSLLDYPDFELPAPDREWYRMGTRGLYLDPALPRVRDRLVETFRDLLVRYPRLAGLHLDYIRHPGVLPFAPGSRFGVGLEFGYGAESRARYVAETGRPDPIEGAPPGVVRHANAWDAWRRDQVTRLVEEIATATRGVRPGVVLSAAVIAYADRAYLSLAQDWRGWLASGAIDRAIPMAYTLDDQLLGYWLESWAGTPDAARIWPGLGVWLFDDAPGRATAQIEQVRALGFTGEVLFSDDALSEAPALEAALAANAPGRVAAPVPEPNTR